MTNIQLRALIQTTRDCLQELDDALRESLIPEPSSSSNSSSPGSSSSSSSSSYAPPKGPDKVCVSGAGSSEVSGTYSRTDSTLNSQYIYRLDRNPNYGIAFIEGKWQVFRAQFRYYIADGADNEGNPAGLNYSPTGLGQVPGPVINEGTCV